MKKKNFELKKTTHGSENTPFEMKTNTKKTFDKKNLPPPKRKHKIPCGKKKHTQDSKRRQNTKHFFKKNLETKTPNLLQKKDQNRL